jgi:hypothetical protein
VLGLDCCLQVAWLVDCLLAIDHLSSTAARTRISLSSNYNTWRQQAHMSALTVAVQQTSNGSAPILDTDYPSSARNYIANVLATVLKPYNPLTIQQSAKAKRHPCAQPASASLPHAATPGKQLSHLTLRKVKTDNQPNTTKARTLPTLQALSQPPNMSRLLFQPTLRPSKHTAFTRPALLHFEIGLSTLRNRGARSAVQKDVPLPRGGSQVWERCEAGWEGCGG